MAFKEQHIERIVNVGWNTGVHMLILAYGISKSTGGLPILSLEVVENTINLSDSGAFETSAGGLVITNLAPYIVVDESGSSLVGVMRINFQGRSALQPPDFTLRISTPALGGTHEVPTIIYWVHRDDQTLQEAKDNPFTTGDPLNPPFGIVTIPIAFSSAEDAGAYAALFLSPTMTVSSEAGTSIVNDAGDWFFDISTYSAREDFPVDAQNNPLWDLGEAVDSVSAGGGGGGGDPVDPAHTFEVLTTYSTRLLALTEL